MKATIKKLPGEPIILVEYEEIDVETVKQVFLQSAELAEGEPDTVYRIVDFRNANGTVEDLKNVVRIIREGVPGSSVDPKFRPVFVGRTDVTWFYETLLAQNEQTVQPIPFFGNVEDALTFVRTHISKG